MKLRKWWYFHKKIQEKRQQIWDREFTREVLLQQREGMRVEYDRIKEQVDAANRRICEEKYEVFYSESGDKVDIRTVPITAEEIESLPTKKSDKSRYHKKLKEDPDKTILENLTKTVEKLTPDLKQLEDQMLQIEQRVEGPLIHPDDPSKTDNSLNGSAEGLYSLIDMLKKHMKNL